MPNDATPSTDVAPARKEQADDRARMRYVYDDKTRWPIGLAQRTTLSDRGMDSCVYMYTSLRRTNMRGLAAEGEGRERTRDRGIESLCSWTAAAIY